LSRRVAITTLGCKANQYDSAVLRAACSQRGWTIVPFAESADAYIVNTCTVTQSADAQSRQLLRRARRKNRDALLIATGCYAQVAPEELECIEGVTHVIGTTHRQEVVGVLEDAWGAGVNISTSTHQHINTIQNRVRPFLKIQDGCDLYCTYCIIPKARGTQRSVPVVEVLAQLAAYHDSGYDEVVLTGIHIGTYGRDLDPPVTFTDLLRAIVIKRPVPRVRISSLDPHEITDEMMDLCQEDVVCPHLHVAIQSGSDKTLRRMARRYRRAVVDAILDRLSQQLPDMAIGTDFIVGFPGETAADHDATAQLIAQSPISFAHVFPYSQRRGTPATRLDAQIPAPIITERAAHLRALADEKRHAYYRSHVGRVSEAIAEGRRDRQTGKVRAMTPHYLPLLIESTRQKKSSTRRPPHCYSPVRILDVSGDEVYAQWI
jgi:threonylcarbamoyladenosine tRNA methylthiotransferase MtaB